MPRCAAKLLPQHQRSYECPHTTVGVTQRHQAYDIVRHDSLAVRQEGLHGLGETSCNKSLRPAKERLIETGYNR